MKVKEKIRALVSSSSEVLCSFPCLACGAELGEGKNLFCGNCLAELNIIKPPRCPGCGGTLDGVLEYCSKCMEFKKRPWDKAYALFNLTGEGQHLLYAFKFYGRPEMARPFAALAWELLEHEALEADYIVPVPLHWSRTFTRGYNQSVLFCEELSRLSGIKCRKLLRRVKRTRQQARLDKDERKINLSGAFALKKNIDLDGKSVLLVDDVLTTGATLSAAAKAFRACGLKALYTLVIGRR